MTPAKAVTRITSGSLQPIEHDSLNNAVRAVLTDHLIALGELAPIRDLPEMARAAAHTL